MNKKRLAQQSRAASLIYAENAAARRQARFDDFMHMVKAGCSAEDAARRLNTNARALQRQAYRWNREDIARYLSSLAYRERHNL